MPDNVIIPEHGRQVPYTADYQIRLLAHLALDKQFFKTSTGTLLLSDFALPACQLVLEVLQDYYSRYKDLPSFGMLELHLTQMMNLGKTATRLTPEEYESLAYVIQMIAEYSAKGGLDVQYFQSQLAEYLKAIRTTQIVGAFQNNVGQNPSAFINQIAQLEKAVAVNRGIVLDDMYGNPEPQLKQENICRISTGLQPLNNRLSGGLGIGELGMIVACPGVGKTTTQLNFMDGANLAGWRTLFITLEMSGKRIKYRHQGIAAGIPAHYFKLPMCDWPEDMLRRWDAVMRPSYRCFGYATIADMSTAGHTLVDIDATIEMWKEKVTRDGNDVATCRGVYVDWLDMLDIKGMSREAKTYELLQQAAKELSRLARKHQVALWTATQGTAAADGREILNMKHTAGAYHKNDALDVNVSIGTIHDPATIARLKDDDKTAVSEDVSMDENNVQVIPCDRKLMLNLAKNRDNTPCAFEVYQGPTLKLWAKYQDSLAADELLKKGFFTQNTANLERIGKRKV